MEELRLGDQVIRYDPVATTAAYKRLASGGADRCNCVLCRNFAAQRDRLNPETFHAVLRQLGIDSLKEGEVYDMVGPFADRTRPTGGWFYFVGELIERGEKLTADGEFQYWFQPYFPRPPAGFGDRVAAIEFRVNVPWVLEEDPY